ncbi:MAG: YihY/virulence factor BrkB family protein [Actinomycetota bacterium]|nr:YihY/virulence factor BrkB family protein [Actinomycetota bacterium]
MTPATRVRTAAAVVRRNGPRVVGRGWKRTLELNLATHSLALAAQQILCTAPLLVAFSAFRRNADDQNVGAVLSRYLGLSRSAARDVSSLFKNTETLSTSTAVFGLVVALAFATSIAVTQQRWYELVWSQRRGSLLSSTLRQLLWVVGLCGYLVIVLYAGRTGHRVGVHVHASRPAGPVAQFVVSYLFFWWSQHLLLGGRVNWHRLVPGAVAMAVSVTALVGLSGLVMSGEIVTESSDYGLIGATFVLSVWLVVLSGTLFLGALVGELIDEHRPAPAGPGGPSEFLGHPALGPKDAV